MTARLNKRSIRVGRPVSLPASSGERTPAQATATPHATSSALPVLTCRSKRGEQALLLRTAKNQRDLLTEFIKTDATRPRQSKPPDIERLYAQTLELQLNRRALR